MQFLNFKRLEDLKDAFLQFCVHLFVLFRRFFQIYAPLLLVCVESRAILVVYAHLLLVFRDEFRGINSHRYR